MPHRIAVLADTHDRWPLGLNDRLEGADEIWHLGDVCQSDLLLELSGLGPPVTVVRGNNDHDFSWPLVRTLTRCGIRFHLEHIPPRRAPANCDCLLHGHTHVPRDEQIGAVRWLNPGAVSFANRGAPASFAWITLKPPYPLRWELIPL